MARESQGLQVLLIVFVMLAVVLGVTTYLYNKQAFEATKHVSDADQKVKDAAKEKDAIDKKYARLREIIGYRDWELDQIEKKFDEDQQMAGAAPKAAEGDQKQPTVMGYSQMLAGACKTIDDRTAELKESKNQWTDLNTRFGIREAASKDAVAILDKGSSEMKDRIAKIETDYTTHQTAMKADEDRNDKAMKDAKEKATQAQLIAADEVKNAKVVVAKAEAEKADVIGKLRDQDRQEMTTPSGEITWVSLPNKTVWINRGRADSLQRQTRFTVYSGESPNSATAVKKGIVEVTRIVADHQAECRIVDDKLTDPMMSGDKVFTALWSPGQQNHFALTGIMNLDGDGHNQMNAAIALIKDSGGVVDCWLDEQGRRQGQITGNTQYYVEGDPPDKGSQETVKNHGDILRDAERNHLHKWSLSDFKQKMNYQKTSSVEHFGSSASPVDADAARAAKARAKAASKAEDSGK